MYSCKSRDSANVSTQQTPVHIIVAETERETLMGELLGLVQD